MRTQRRAVISNYSNKEAPEPAGCSAVRRQRARDPRMRRWVSTPVAPSQGNRACTARAPRQVFEQLLQERERSCRWYPVGSEALPFPLIGSG